MFGPFLSFPKVNGWFFGGDNLLEVNFGLFEFFGFVFTLNLGLPLLVCCCFENFDFRVVVKGRFVVADGFLVVLGGRLVVLGGRLVVL